jgi:hypothetical protein
LQSWEKAGRAGAIAFGMIAQEIAIDLEGKRRQIATITP